MLQNLGANVSKAQQDTLNTRPGVADQTWVDADGDEADVAELPEPCLNQQVLPILRLEVLLAEVLAQIRQSFRPAAPLAALDDLAEGVANQEEDGDVEVPDEAGGESGQEELWHVVQEGCDPLQHSKRRNPFLEDIAGTSAEE